MTSLTAFQHERIVGASVRTRISGMPPRQRGIVMPNCWASPFVGRAAECNTLRGNRSRLSFARFLTSRHQRVLRSSLCDGFDNRQQKGFIMTKLLSHTLNASEIRQREDDGYIHATALCQAAGKRLNNYLRNEQTQDFLKALESDALISVSKLVTIVRGRGDRVTQGTWVHPKVAIHLAMWLSPEFAVQVTTWVYDWMSRRAVPERPQPALEGHAVVIIDGEPVYIDTMAHTTAGDRCVILDPVSGRCEVRRIIGVEKKRRAFIPYNSGVNPGLAEQAEVRVVGKVLEVH